MAKRIRLGAMTAVIVCTAFLQAIELTNRARLAFEDYAERAEQSFSSAPFALIGELAPKLRGGVIAGRPGSGNGIVEVPDGLIHHWRGAAFLADATVDTALRLSRNYAQYSAVYESVVSSQLLEHEGDTFRVRLRIRERAGVVTSVVDIFSTVTYGRIDACSGYSVSRATEIREIVDAGQPGERALPAGTGHGYLWRATTFSSYRQQDGGVYLFLETLGLSRGYPAMLGWIIGYKPIARRLGRKSVEGALAEFRQALMKSPPPNNLPGRQCG